MDTMRKDGSGTYDGTTKKFKLRRTGKPTIAASVRKLSELFAVDLPANERICYPYWCKYRDEQLAIEAEADGTTTDKRLIKLSEMLSLKAEFSELEALYAQGRAQDYTLLGESLSKIRGLLELAPNTAERKRVEAHLPLQDIQRSLHERLPSGKNSSKKLTLIIDTYVQEYEDAGKTGVSDIKLALGLLRQVAGGLDYDELNVLEYKKLNELIKQSAPAESTWHTRQKIVNTFLRNIESNCGHWYYFIRNANNLFSEPPGQKIQYNLAQMKEALNKATGIARVALLWGLNCGFCATDIAEITADMWDGTHLRKTRAKNKRRNCKFEGCWRLWDETKAVLQFGMKADNLEDKYNAFANANGLPTLKALRKGVSQLIYDAKMYDESRLYRAENVKGVHGKNYIKMSDAQVASLDVALDKIHDMLFN